jgi:hypothetical protein
MTYLLELAPRDRRRWGTAFLLGAVVEGLLWPDFLPIVKLTVKHSGAFRQRIPVSRRLSFQR